jgi:LPXTG-motif cell wall-anchored protein
MIKMDKNNKILLGLGIIAGLGAGGIYLYKKNKTTPITPSTAPTAPITPSTAPITPYQNQEPNTSDLITLNITKKYWWTISNYNFRNSDFPDKTQFGNDAVEISYHVSEMDIVSLFSRFTNGQECIDFMQSNKGQQIEDLNGSMLGYMAGGWVITLNNKAQ